MTTPHTVKANYFSETDTLHIEFRKGVFRIKRSEAMQDPDIKKLWERLVAQIKADDATSGAVDNNFFSNIILLNEDLISLLLLKRV